MKATWNLKAARPAAAVLAIFSLFPPAPPAAAQSAGPQTFSWRVNYLNNTKGPARKERVAVTFEGDELVCAAGPKVLFSIPLASITEVVSFSGGERRALAAGLRTAGRLPVEILKNSGGSSADAQLAAGVLTLYMVYGFVPTFAISSIVHKRKERYLVRIGWEENSMLREAAFELNPSAYKSFLPQLQRATGKEWVNLAAQKQRLEEAKNNGGIVILPRRAMAGSVELEPGRYRIVLLEDRGEVYFIQGTKFNTKRIAAVVEAETLPGPVDAEPASLTLVENGTVVAIQDVRLRRKTLRLKTGLPNWPGAEKEEKP
jgi:hypothetical protein